MTCPRGSRRGGRGRLSVQITAASVLTVVSVDRTWSQTTFLEPFADAEVLELRESAPDAQGRFERLKIVRAEFKYPYLRIRQWVEADPLIGVEAVVASTEMVADHIIVKLAEGRAEAELAHTANVLGGSIRRKLYSPRMYLIAIGAHGIDSVPVAVEVWTCQNVLAFSAYLR